MKKFHCITYVQVYPAQAIAVLRTGCVSVKSLLHYLYYMVQWHLTVVLRSVHSSMWSELQTVPSLERCPLQRGSAVLYMRMYVRMYVGMYRMFCICNDSHCATNVTYVHTTLVFSMHPSIYWENFARFKVCNFLDFAKFVKCSPLSILTAKSLILSKIFFCKIVLLYGSSLCHFCWACAIVHVFLSSPSTLCPLT